MEKGQLKKLTEGLNTHTRTHTHNHTHNHTHIHTCSTIQTQTRTNTFPHTQPTNTHTHTHTHTHKHIPTHSTYKHTQLQHAHTYTRTHNHTRTNLETDSNFFFSAKNIPIRETPFALNLYCNNFYTNSELYIKLLLYEQDPWICNLQPRVYYIQLTA